MAVVSCLIFTAALIPIHASSAERDQMREFDLYRHTAPKPETHVIVLTADKQFDLARDFLNQRDYALAVAEFRRFIYFFPMDPRIGRAQLYMADAFFRADAWEPAIATLDALIVNPATPRHIAFQALLLRSRCHQALNRFDQARLDLQYLLDQDIDPLTRDKAGYELGWIDIAQHNWSAAAASFALVRPSVQSRHQIGALIDALRHTDLKPQQKSPVAAGLLAIIPGAGHLYCGRYQDALIAFALNGLLIGAAVESFDHDLPVLGALITAAGVGFYSGNIYSAVSSAHKHNRRVSADYANRLQKQFKIDLSLISLKNGIGMYATWMF